MLPLGLTEPASATNLAEILAEDRNARLRSLLRLVLASLRGDSSIPLGDDPRDLLLNFGLLQALSMDLEEARTEGMRLPQWATEQLEQMLQAGLSPSSLLEQLEESRAMISRYFPEAEFAPLDQVKLTISRERDAAEFLESVMEGISRGTVASLDGAEKLLAIFEDTFSGTITANGASDSGVRRQLAEARQRLYEQQSEPLDRAALFQKQTENRAGIIEESAQFEAALHSYEQAAHFGGETTDAPDRAESLRLALAIRDIDADVAREADFYRLVVRKLKEADYEVTVTVEFEHDGADVTATRTYRPINSYYEPRNEGHAEYLDALRAEAPGIPISSRHSQEEQEKLRAFGRRLRDRRTGEVTGDVAENLTFLPAPDRNF